MLKNYFVTAWRSILRNKLYTSINILGLSIGVSACLVIYLLVSYELSFNKGHKAYESIYRIHSAFTGQMAGINRGVPPMVAQTVREQFKGIESVALAHSLNAQIRIPTGDEDKELNAKTAILLTEPSYFEIFQSYDWIVGSPDVLNEPFRLVLTESGARNYFGDVNPETLLGKEVIYQDSLSVTVAGIVRDLPFSTDIDFSDFISISTVDQSWLKQNIILDNWGSISSGCQVFLKTLDGTTRDVIESQLPILAKEFKDRSHWNAENNFALQSLSELHFDTATGIFDHSGSAAHMPTLISLVGVAVLLLVIGAINFINLETAQSIRRSKEVGVRKVLGSSRSRLVLQFLSQSLIVTLVAVILALPLSEFALRLFREFIPNQINLGIPEIIPFVLAVIFVIGILAGLYPAFVLSSFMPAQALKSANPGSATSGSFLRKSLIVFQFTFAQVLILGTLVMHVQISYMINKDLGFKKDAIIYFNTPRWESPDKMRALENELALIPEVSEMTLSESPPAYRGWSASTFKYTGKDGEINLTAYRKIGDTNYLDFYGIETLEGREVLPSDTLRELMINETMMKALGFQTPAEAIGQEVEFGPGRLPIVGVVKDFHVMSLHKKVEAVVIGNASEEFGCFNVKFAYANEGSEQFTAGIKKIEDVFKKIYPDSEFNYKFLDETLKNFYSSEQRASKLADTATGLAIFISCLGLFGLVSYTTLQRTKEIGIRKVMGASVSSVVMLLSRSFVGLVLIAFLVASPLAWYGTQYWLNDFAYKIEVNTLMFLLTLVLAVAIAFATVSWKTIGAAKANPADSLRSE